MIGMRVSSYQKDLWLCSTGGKISLVSFIFHAYHARAIHMDPSIHKDPENFDPARYLNKPLGAAEYLNTSDPYERDHFTYGAGRRVCQGIHLAERSLYINIVRTLWGFNITKKVDSDGKEIEPDCGMVRGFLSVPNPFITDIKPRSEKHAEIIRTSFEEAEKEGLNY